MPDSAREPKIQSTWSWWDPRDFPSWLVFPPEGNSMPEVLVAQITRDRLEEWGKRLIEAHATPLILIGVGQDYKQGTSEVLAVGDLSDEDVQKFLSGLAARIRDGFSIKHVYSR